jgi:hypothetical protein
MIRLLLAAFSLAGGPVLAQVAPTAPEQIAAATSADQSVKGVNPADVLDRADLIVKVIDLPTGSAWAMVGKFDKSLADGFLGAIEVPFLQGLDAGPVSATGVGDTLVKFRKVMPLGGSLVGIAAMEFVLPTATEPALGAGKWQVNPGAGVVQIWSRHTFTVLLYKHSFSVAGDKARSDISVHSARALQTLILGRGWYATLDGRHEWQRRGRDEDWTQVDFEIGRQFSRRFAASAKIGKTWGDRSNNGALELNVRTFF